MSLIIKIGSAAGSLLLAGLLLAGTPAARAQGGARVAAALADSAVEAGEEAQYQISVVNGEADQPPPAPAVPGLTFQYAGQQQSRQYNFGFGGGTNTTQTTYAYNVRADKPGRYVIPGQGVQVAGATLRTLPVTLIVQGGADGGAPQPRQAATVELVISKKTAYVGESVPVEVRASFGPDLHFKPDANVILNGEGFSVQKFTPPRLGAQVVEGVRFTTAIYQSAVAGVKTGTLAIGPVDTEPVVQLPLSRARRSRFSNDPFDDPFFSNGFGAQAMQPARQIKVSSQPVTLEVLPLPPGQPAGYAGAVGQFRLTAEAETASARTGDPVTVRLTLSGQGNFDRAPAPVLEDERGLRAYPPSAQFKPDDEAGLGGVKTFEQAVIADGPRESLPGYRFSYFDPAAGKYVSLDTAPIPVKITGTAPPPPTVAAAPAEAILSATPTPAPPRKAEDILHIRSDPGPLRDRTAFLPVYRRPEFWRRQGVPLAVVLAAGIAAAARARARDGSKRRLAARLRQQAELQRALRQETTGRRDFYAAATRLAQLRAGPGRADDAPLTAAEICQSRRLDSQTADQVQSLFHRRDELAYSGGPSALEPVPEAERQEVLAALDTLSK